MESKSKKTLADLFKDYQGDYQPTEWNCGADVGREVLDSNNIRIKITYDPEADVFIATSDDMRGLVLESDSLHILAHRVSIAVPELLELNGEPPADDLIFCLRLSDLLAYEDHRSK